MATRSIVTSQPDVACDVCERRMLRGEQPDVFLDAGRRLIVCELCAARALHEGWVRETDRESLSLPPLRPRRGRSLFERLRQLARPAAGVEEALETGAPSRDEVAQPAEPQPYDFLDDEGGAAAAASAPIPAVPRGPSGGLPAQSSGAGEPTAGDDAPALAAGQVSERTGEQPAEPAPELDRALEAFNASEHPRRVAGVARSLGMPEVNVRSAEHARSVVRIVVAWELCWYQYEVDLDEPEAGTHVAAQGTELGELAREDRQVNAVADDAGALSLSAA